MKPRLFEAVMAKPNEQRELYEQLKLKAEHPFLKRYAAVGIKEGTVIAGETEKGVFEALGLPYPLPSQREIVDDKPLWMPIP